MQGLAMRFKPRHKWDKHDHMGVFRNIGKLFYHSQPVDKNYIGFFG